MNDGCQRVLVKFAVVTCLIWGLLEKRVHKWWVLVVIAPLHLFSFLVVVMGKIKYSGVFVLGILVVLFFS